MTGPPKPTVPHRLTVPVALTATFVQLLDVTIVQVTLPVLRRDLGTGAGPAQLVLTGYLLAYACTLIPAARLGDRYGYRRLLVTGMVVFTLASAGCAAAPGAVALVAARVVQGAGSGLMAPQVLSLIQTALPADRRPHALALLGATMGVSSLAGPTLGGLLVAADPGGLGWRLVFLVNLPVGVAALVGMRLLPAGRDTARGVACGAARDADRQPVNLPAAVLVMAGVGLLLVTLSVGPDRGWLAWAGSAWTWLCLGGAAGALAAFALTQRTAREPLFDPRVLRTAATRRGVALVLVFNAGVPSFSYLLLLYLQTGLGYSPLHAAVAVAPYPAAAIVGARIAPLLSRRHGPRVLTAGAATLAAVMAAITGTGGRPWPLLPLLAVGGAAFGTITALVFAHVLAAAPAGAAGSVSGLLPTAQQLGGSLGIAAAGLALRAPASGPRAAFTHAMVYQTAVFLAAAACSLTLRTGRASPDRAPPAVCQPGPVGSEGDT